MSASVKKDDIFPMMEKNERLLFSFARSNFFHKFLVNYFSYHSVTILIAISCLNS